MADFGLSRVCDEALVETKTYGTVTHMPPELLLEGKLSKSADVYAYGVLLFELCTADRPWGGLRQAEVLHKVAVKHERLQLPADTPQLFQVCSCQLQNHVFTHLHIIASTMLPLTSMTYAGIVSSSSSFRE